MNIYVQVINYFLNVFLFLQKETIERKLVIPSEISNDKTRSSRTFLFAYIYVVDRGLKIKIIILPTNFLR